MATHEKAATHKKSTTKSSTKSSTKTNHKSPRKWSAKVQTDSTHPDEGLFKEDAQTIADALFSSKVSPKGPASGMQMLNFYINRAGKNLSSERHTTLEHAKEILSRKIAESK
jgi:tRNA(adenine34) deaminase